MSSTTAIGLGQAVTSRGSQHLLSQFFQSGVRRNVVRRVKNAVMGCKENPFLMKKSVVARCTKNNYASSSGAIFLRNQFALQTRVLVIDAASKFVNIKA